MNRTRTVEAAAMTALTPHDAMAAWGAAVDARSAARASWKAAERAYDVNNVEERERTARAADDAGDVYNATRRLPSAARRAVCDAYTQAGFPQAFRVLRTIAPGALGWTPDLEAVLAALLEAPTHT